MQNKTFFKKKTKKIEIKSQIGLRKIDVYFSLNKFVYPLYF